MLKVCTCSRLCEPGIDLTKCLEAADHQARAHEQHQRQRYLHHHQRMMRALAIARQGAAATAGERVRDLRSGEFQDREETEQET